MLEPEQIIKRIDWIDEEQRKDKSMLLAIEERLTHLDDRVSPLNKQIKELDSELTRLVALLGRIDDVDEALLNIRVEGKRMVEALEKELKQRQDEAERIRRVEMRALENSIGDVRKELAPIAELRRTFQAQNEELSRLSRSLDELRVRIDAIRRSEDEYTRSYRLLEDGRRQDSKKLTDLQGEVTALRKHSDDQRGRIELLSSSVKKMESRVSELLNMHDERQESQAKFLEEQALKQVEREREWKSWLSRLEVIDQQTTDIETQLQNLDSTQRAVRRSQQSLDELAEKVERRINEMAEIQRLSEERFRQEWVTFKADDQKRWTNYMLTQEEGRGETGRQVERLAERITTMEDSLQVMNDQLHLMNEANSKQLQSLLSLVHEWVNAHERSSGRIS